MTFPRFPEYKDSGIEWPTEAPIHWEVIPAKYKIKTLSGGQTTKNLVSDEPLEGLYPAFSASGQDIWMEEYEFDTEGVVLSAVGARCGKTFKANGKWGVVANTHCLFPKLDVDRDFLWYLTNREEWWEKGGTAQPFVKVSDSLARKFFFPDRIEQSKIARFLDLETAKIDSLIGEQEKLIDLLKEQRQAMISNAVTKGLDPNVKMKDSGVEWFGEIPAHWKLTKLKYLSSGIKAGPFGSAITKDMYTNSGYRVYGQEQVIPGDFSIGDYYIDEVKFQELRQYEVKPLDLLISCVGTFGKIAVVPESVEAGIINPRLIRLRTNNEVKPRFLLEVLRSRVVFEQFASTTRGGTMDTINIGNLCQIWIALPPFEEQMAITDEIQVSNKNIDLLVSETKKAIELLQERRSSLISAAVTGQIDVRNAVTEQESV